eukprot:COSAG02_NODE_2393_length_8966_cov_3.095974_3_plen_50_part_00
MNRSGYLIGGTVSKYVALLFGGMRLRLFLPCCDFHLELSQLNLGSDLTF